MVKKTITILVLVFILSASIIMAEGNFTTIVSSPTIVGRQDGSLIYPYGMAYSKDLDALIFTDIQNHTINILDLKTLKIETLSGVSKGVDRFGFPGAGYVDGDINKAMFNRPKGIAIADNGAILIADSGNNAIRQIYKGKVTTIAGGKDSGYKDDKGTKAKFLNPSGIVIDKKANIFISDTLNDLIRKIDGGGNVTTFAGKKDNKDLLNEPVGLAFDKDDNLFVADASNHQIKKIREDGKIDIVAGNYSLKDEESDYWLGGYMNGPMEISYFNFPKGLTIKDDGGIFVSDSYNHVIRMIKDGNVSTVVGGGVSGFELDEENIIDLDGPRGILYAKETLFIADYWNNRIVLIPHNGRHLDPIHMDDENTEILVFLDGNQVNFSDLHPLNLEGKIQIPLRRLGEALEFEVLWDQKKKLVTLVKDNDEVVFSLEEGDFIIYEGKSLVGLHVLNERFDLEVKWLDNSNIISIQHKLKK